MKAVPFFQRLQTRLIALVAVCVTLPALAIAMFAMDRTAVALVDAGKERNVTVLDEIAKTLADELFELRRTLAGSTQIPAVRATFDAHASDKPVSRVVIRDLYQFETANRLCDRLMVVDPEAKILATTRSPRGRAAAIAKLIAGPWKNGERDRHSRLETGSDDSIVLSAAPVKDKSHGLRGFVIMETSGSDLFRLVSVSARTLGKRTLAFVVDNEKRVLLNSELKTGGFRRDLGEQVLDSGTQPEVEWGHAKISGEDHFFMTRKIPRLAWTYGIATPSAEFLAPVEKGRRTILFTALIALVLALLGALLLGSKMTRPIRRLHRSVDSFARGEPTFVDVASVDEVGLLCQAYNQLLEDLISHQDTLELALAKSAELIANKSDFVGDHEHDLRNSLATILAFADLLREGADASQNQLIEAIETSAAGILAMVDEALEAAKSEMGEVGVEWRTFSVTNLVADVADVSGPRCQEHDIDWKVRFDSKLPSSVSCDPEHIEQALINVVDYAIGVADSGRVTLAVQYDAEAADPLRFRITDTGAKIFPEDAKQLFEGFMQSQGDPDGPTATLGLSVSKRLARLLGGDVTLERNDGDDSPSFVVSFATVVADEAAWIDEPKLDERRSSFEEPRTVGDDNLNGRMVLCVEDPAGFQVTSRVLGAAGARVESVGDKASALEAVRTHSVLDVVVIDLELGGADGCHIAGELRRAGYRGSIVGMTIDRSPSTRRRCLDSEFDDCLVKPVGRKELVGCIAEMASKALGVSS